jgi:hypothetical protein
MHELLLIIKSKDTLNIIEPFHSQITRFLKKPHIIDANIGNIWNKVLSEVLE